MIALLLLFISCISCVSYADHKPIVVFIPSYNNLAFYKKNLDSVFMQNYPNFYVVYVDDCSADGTGAAVAAYLKECHLDEKVILIHNTERRGALYNHYMVAHALPDFAIMATLDGDDWFPDGKTDVLTRVNEVYQDPNVWMTYGQFAEYPSGRKGFCRPLATCTALQIYRDFPFIMSHLRTFYAGLFKQIPVGYFIKDGNFLQATCDLAMMFSLLELSGGKAACIDEVLYIYNTTNGNSDCYTRLREQINNDHWIRARAPLQPLAENPAYLAKKNVPNVYNWHISSQDYDACHTYCASLAIGGIAPEGVQIWYTAERPEQINAYTQLAQEYSVLTTAISPFTDCKTIMLATLDMMPEESFIILTLDGCTWRSPVEWYDTVKIISKTKALAYTATMDINNTYNPTTILLHDHYYLWKPAATQGIYHHPYATPAMLISKAQLHHALTQITGATLSELLDNLAYLAPENSEDVMLCSAHPSVIYKG